MIFFLVGLPECLEDTISNQFQIQQLNATDRGEIERISAVSMYTPEFSAIFMFGLVSLLGSLTGPLPIVKSLVPITAISQLVPFFLLWSPTLWGVGTVGFFTPLSRVLYVPLNALVSIVAPPGRVSEAMSCTGAAKELAPLLANLATPPLISFFGTDRLWIFFALSSGMIFLALPFALDLNVVNEDEDDTSSDDDENDGGELGESS